MMGYYANRISRQVNPEPDTRLDFEDSGRTRTSDFEDDDNYNRFEPPDEYGEEHGSFKEKTRCSLCLSGFWKLLRFALSHAGLVSLVISYCLLGAFTFERLERNYEIAVKKNMSKVRSEVSTFLWEMTEKSLYIAEDQWVLNASLRLQVFEWEIIRLMRKDGWDGVDSLETRQWTFAGALFYSIVVITTIGYGHITPKTEWGKIVTIFYAILGIPLMLICLSHIGDFLATAFRILYWKVCCYVCTRRPRVTASPAMWRGRSLRYSSRNARYATPKRSLRRSKSCRVSQRSEESANSDNSMMAHRSRGFRRALSHEDFRNMTLPKPDIRERQPSASPSLRSNAPKTYYDPETMSVHNLENQNPRFGSSLGGPTVNIENANDKLPIFVNKHAIDDITPSSSFRSRNFQRRMNHLQPSRPVEQFVMNEYMEHDDYDEYSNAEDEEIHTRPVPIWLCIVLVVGYIIGGAFLFHNWEGWGWLDSAYFCFVTLTTIGFGDYVPAQKVKRDVEMSIALCSLYLLFGISLLAMSFNLVQEQVISSVKNLATKLGIIKEEDEE